MTEFIIVCVHRWGPVQTWIDKSIPEEDRRYVDVRGCSRCDGYWKVGEAEPRVIIGRIQEEKSEYINSP